MSSLIEQAAQRLMQLRRAGVEIPLAEPPLRPAVERSATRHGVPATAATVATVTTSMPRVSEFDADAALQSRRVAIDLNRLAKRGIITPKSRRTPMADQFRVLKRPLIDNAMGKGAAALHRGNLIMVTSSLPGEGKTFTAMNLAMSIAAELDNTVMLVDADVARPSVLRRLGLEPSPGLLDVLEGKATVPGCLMRTNVDKLTLLPSGTPHPRATELLASDLMRDLLDDMATRYPDRIIIFDSPPLLLTTESRVLATHMGQLVVVVCAGKTLQADVQNALSTIDTCPVKMMVLNKARPLAWAQGKSDRYGYGYGHKYGYRYGKYRYQQYK